MPWPSARIAEATHAILVSLRSRGLEAASPAHEAVFVWAAQRRRTKGPWVLGVSGPQGGGKSTLAESLRTGFEAMGLRAVAISIDDFYLTRDEQIALTMAHATNDLLSVRGYPGTHDVTLGVRVLDALVERTSGIVEVPRYDKSAHGGVGNRPARSSFGRVSRPVDVVIFEGWMLGFAPVGEGELTDARLTVPNRLLAAYEAWWSRMDAVLVMQAPDVRQIVDWRVDAEAARRRAGLGALDEAVARSYAERFVPAYETYLPGLLARSRSVSGWANVRLDASRVLGPVADATA